MRASTSVGGTGSFTVNESADKPYQFNLSGRFIVDEEILSFRTITTNPVSDFLVPATGQPQADQPTFGEVGVTPDGQVGIRRGTGVFS